MTVPFMVFVLALLALMIVASLFKDKNYLPQEAPARRFRLADSLVHLIYVIVVLSWLQYLAGPDAMVEVLKNLIS